MRLICSGCRLRAGIDAASLHHRMRTLRLAKATGRRGRVIRIVGQIGIAVLVVGMLSCNSQSPTTIAKASPTPAKPALPKDENGNDLPVPEIVHARQVHIENGDVKSVIVGNDNGEYTLFCNTKRSEEH